MVEELRARRDLLVEGLNALLGVSCRTPAGAFYAFPNVSEVPIDSDLLAELLLEQAGVAVLSGAAFGPRGENHLRVSFANSRENLTAALERMHELLTRLAAHDLQLTGTSQSHRRQYVRAAPFRSARSPESGSEQSQ